MAKNPKKFDITPDVFNETRVPSDEPIVNTHEHEHTHTHNHTHEHEPVARVKKDRRVQWLTYDSLIQRIDAYAKERGVSRADALEAMAEKFLSDLGR